MEEPSGLDLAWAAGFFDGEGCVRIQKESVQRRLNLHYLLQVIVVNTDPAPLDALSEWFGGNVHRRDRTDGHKTLWWWELGSAAAERFLRAIRPYSIVKCEQIDLALEFRATFDPSYPKKLGLTSDILDCRERQRLILASLK